MVAERAVRFDYVAGNLLRLRACIGLGLATSLGYLHLIYALTRGGMAVLAGDSPSDAMNACEFYQARYWIGAPGGLAGMLAFYEESNARRSPFCGMLCAGSLLSKRLSERVRARMCANLVSLYGATEVSMVATAPAHLTAGIAGAVGHPVPGVTVEAVDEGGSRLASAVKASSGFAALTTSEDMSERRMKTPARSATDGSIRATSDRSRRTTCWSSPDGRSS
jgi:acyl-coenzyme A synthetase/AMP-(fatty) acid ligase